MEQRGVPLVLKRAFDIAAAGVALVVLAPLLLVLALGVLVSTGRPVLFRQMRPGRNGRPFQLVKFRTMRHVEFTIADPRGDAARLTPFGRFLRASSLDELPELWNVLKGEMSLVGPRPLLMQYLPRYSPEQARRHAVLPGLTGWAQVNGRNATTWRDRFERDVWYVDHWSLWLDARILVRTVSAVLRRHGVSREGHATMPEFHGDE
jgi:lipopolysaccharide/colanic/teichoic acid biosynthesis glycosyltransferase